MNPDPATDPVAYNKICQADADGARLQSAALLARAAAGAEDIGGHASLHLGHALRSDRGRGGGGRGGGGGGGGAVPHRTYPGVNSPWVAPGTYTVRLTANGKSMTQPITIKMDPRVKITPEVQQIFTLTTQMEAEREERGGGLQGRSRACSKRPARTKRCVPRSKSSRRPQPPEREGRGGGGGRGGPPEPPPVPNLANIAGLMVGAAMPMQASEMPPTATQLAACSREEAAYTAVMAKWTALKTKVSGPPKSAPKSN